MAAPAKSPSLPLGLPALLLAALAYQWLQGAGGLMSVLREGAFFDTDDAMRLVGVRAWLAGQPWFDLSAHRMGMVPVPMHWSRVVDLPLAALIRVFGLVLSPAAAETATRIVFPAGLFLLFALGLSRAAATLAGPSARLPALLLAALGSMAADQFVPGRIDHHGPQIVLLTFAIGHLLRSFDERQAPRALTAGLLAALSLSISIENVPFLAVIVAAIGTHWILRGAPARRQMLMFACGFSATAIVLYLLFVPPQDRGAEVCDAFGAFYLTAVLAGSAILGLIACAAPPRAGLRLATACLGALAVIGVLRLTHPDCLGDPFVGLPPFLRDVWLKNVSEAQPLTAVLARRPFMALPLVVPPLLALAGMLLLARGETDPVGRARYLTLAALCAGGLLAACWMVRTESSLGAPVMIAGAALAAHAAGRLRRIPGGLLPVLLPVCLCLPLSSGVLGTLVPAAASDTPASGPSHPASTCTRPGDFTALAGMPPMRLLAPMDAGPYLLVHTPHAVLAAPYHRNIDGNLASLRTFLAAPAEARDVARASGASHLVLCRGLAETTVLAARNPAGLAARLLAGEVPDWLVPAASAGPWQVYRID